MIAIITHNYPSEANPVAGLFVQDHAQILRETTGESVKVLNYPSGVFPMTKGIKNPLKWPTLIKYFLTTPGQIREDIEKLNSQADKPVDIIAHWWFPNGTFATKYFDNVHVICHGTDLYQLQNYPALARRFADRALRVKSWQCVSSDLKRILLELYPFLDQSKITVEPMPIGPMFADQSLERDPHQIVSVGALIERKKFHELIGEVAKIPNLKLDIYGRGPEQQRLESLIADLEVSDRVRLAGQVTREELATIYNRSLLFVLLSVDEGFGLVLKEAQACGCPTMAYTGDGMVDTQLDYPLNRGDAVAPKLKQVLANLADRGPNNISD